MNLPEWKFNCPVHKPEFCHVCDRPIYDKMWRRYPPREYRWLDKVVMTFHPKCGKRFRRKHT
jgi:hypothetical protein